MSKATLRVNIDMRPIAAALKGLERQMPYATSSIVNKVAFAAQKDLRAGLPEDFTIRTSPGAKFSLASGIKVAKGDKHNIGAAVGSVDDYMAKQATGGKKAGSIGIDLSKTDDRKVAVMGGRFVAVPVIGGRARKTWKSRVTRSNLPNVLSEKPKSRVFVQRLEHGRDFGVYQSVGRKKSEKTRLLYYLKRSVKYEKRWALLRRVQDSAKVNFQEIARVELLKILADAQRRAARKG